MDRTEINQNLVAKAGTTINAARWAVWDALVSPEAIKEYMFGTNVKSDWQAGSPITWKGEWEGRPYEDKGVIVQAKPERMLQYTHFSPLSGLPDVPENYHNITIELLDAGSQTRVLLTQDKNATEEERAHSQKNWEMMLQGLKKYVEAS
jgi:uncharacterized protein YndB with AHSA1/START domain